MGRVEDYFLAHPLCPPLPDVIGVAKERTRKRNPP